MKTRNALHTIGNKVLLAALLSIPTLSGAQESSDTPTLDQLDQKIRILERKLEVQDEVTANKTPAPTISVGQDGFTLKSADENFVMKWRGLLQADYRGFVNDTNYSDVRKYKNDSVYVENNYLRQNPKLVNTFLLRRIRPVWDVTLYKYYNLRITPDFGGGTFVLLDAYGEVNFWPEFKVRIGKFTPPIGLERLQASSDNNFVEYNFPAALSPSRDVGVQISGDLLGESVNYAVGYFNGAEDGASKDNDLTDHKDFTGRLFLQPFKSLSIDWLSNLGLGTSGSWGAFWGDSTISNLPSIKSAGQNTIFSYRQNKVPTSGVPLNGVATIVDSLTVRTVGAHYRVNPQGYWYAGPFSLFGEYILSSQQDLYRAESDHLGQCRVGTFRFLGCHRGSDFFQGRKTPASFFSQLFRHRCHRIGGARRTIHSRQKNLSTLCRYFGQREKGNVLRRRGELVPLPSGEMGTRL